MASKPTCRIALLALPFALLGAAVWAAAASAAAPDEAEVKAAVTFNILQFVKWPAPGAPAAGQPLTLCAAESGMARLLAKFGGTRVNDKSLAFKFLNRHLDGLGECHAIFVAAGEPSAVPRIAAATRGKPVLVIAEGDRVLERGAGMGVSLAGSRVVIDVDLNVLSDSGLVVSSKLLRLARTVVK